MRAGAGGDASVSEAQNTIVLWRPIVFDQQRVRVEEAATAKVDVHAQRVAEPLDAVWRAGAQVRSREERGVKERKGKGEKRFFRNASRKADKRQGMDWLKAKRRLEKRKRMEEEAATRR